MHRRLRTALQVIRGYVGRWAFSVAPLPIGALLLVGSRTNACLASSVFPFPAFLGRCGLIWIIIGFFLIIIGILPPIFMQPPQPDDKKKDKKKQPESPGTSSITAWTRLEPRARDATMARSLQAQVRDPLWLLARQWQVSEFAGHDAGSPIHAAIRLEALPLTGYLPGNSANPAVPLDTTLPLQAHVEREPVHLGLRAAVQLGLHFEASLADAFARGAALRDPQNQSISLDAARGQFRSAFAIAATPDPSEVPDAASRTFRRVATGRITNGNALYTVAVAAGAGASQRPATSLPAIWSDIGIQALLQRFVAYRERLYTEPTHDSAWIADRLEYQFAVGAQAASEDVALTAREYPGGHLDWYTFSVTGAAGADSGALPTDVPAMPRASVTAKDLVVIPNHVTFKGMPPDPWWAFEESQADYGQLDTQLGDLPKMIFAEFALLYGGDWFEVPLPLDTGTLARIALLVVTNTFGERTLIRPTEAQTPPRQQPWSMFRLSGDGHPSDWLFLPPTLATIQDGAAVEDVLFLRDDTAAMAWAIERTIQGSLDGPVDAFEAYQQRLAAQAPAPPPAPHPGGPDISYLLGDTVPDNWIPMVPVKSADGRYFLRRGRIAGAGTSEGTAAGTGARGQVLEPGHPFFVTDQAVSPAGAEVTRYFRRGRWSSGQTFVWTARKTRPGRGPGWSGLGFDLLESRQSGSEQAASGNQGQQAPAG